MMSFVFEDWERYCFVALYVYMKILICSLLKEYKNYILNSYINR